jgi:hypothetical protein
MRAVLEKGFEAMAAGSLGAEARRMDEETRRALEAIGYTGR